MTTAQVIFNYRSRRYYFSIGECPELGFGAGEKTNCSADLYHTDWIKWIERRRHGPRIAFTGW